MLSGRWYNTSVTLPNGNLLTMWGRAGGTLTEIFDQNTNTWSALPGIALDSTLEANDLVDDDNQWFPHLHMMPNGKILMAGPLTMMRWLDFTGLGSYQDLGNRPPDGDRHRKLGTSVQYLPGKILFLGGRDDRYNPTVTNTALLIDATTATPVGTSAETTRVRAEAPSALATSANCSNRSWPSSPAPPPRIRGASDKSMVATSGGWTASTSASRTSHTPAPRIRR